MAKKIGGVYEFLRGGFLTEKGSFKNWRMMLYVLVLLMVIIYSSHRADAKVVLISKLNKKKKELRAEYIDTKTALARMKLESSIANRMRKRGYLIGNDQPQKIKLVVKE